MNARWLTLTALVSLCGLVGVFVVGGAVGAVDAAAAGPLPEVVTEYQALNVTATGARVSGTVNPEGVPVSACQFEYGPDIKGKVVYSQSAPCSPSPGSGNAAVPVSATLSLQPGGLYFFRLSATNANGTSYGAEAYVFTLPAVEGVSTGPAEELSTSGARLTGSLSPDGTDAHYYFEYGTSTAYGSTSPVPPGVDAGAGGAKCEPPGGPECSPVAAATTIGSLAENTTYHYRLVAVNELGTTVGGDRELTTFGLPRVQAEAEVKAAEQAGQSTATLRAQIDPEGAEATYRFEYGETTSYGTSVPVPDGTVASGQEFVSVPAAEISELKLGTTYHYRVVASNEYGTTTGPDQQFTTLPAALIEQESAAEVAATSASLKAQINPLGWDTHYYFQYGATESYSSSVPAPPGVDIGSGEAYLPVTVHLQGLEAGTTYHYRVVAVNEAGGEPMTVEGPDQTFTTQAAGTEITQPDGRQWEMVSPPNKQGAAIDALGVEGGSDVQAAANGDGITYTATASFDPNPAGNRSIEATQVISLRRTPDSWNTADITTPHEEGGGSVAVGHSAEYKLFSSDLSLGAVTPAGSTPLPPLPSGEEAVVYLRGANGEYKATVTSANVQPPGGKLRDETRGQLIGFDAGSPDLSHLILESQVALVPGAPAEGGLYEWATGGQLQLVSVLPDGEPESRANLGYRGFSQGGNTRKAISDDGSRVVWESEGEGGRYYLRDTVKDETVPVDAAQGTPEPTVRSSIYRTANSEGSRVFFTSTGPLTANSTANPNVGAEDLYVFEVTSGEGEPLAGKLTDLTVDGNAEETAAVQGVIGASEDGSYVYFVARGPIGDAKEHEAVPGNNLYVEHYDETAKTWGPPKFIAELSDNDANFEDLKHMTARVSPDGRHLAFMSEKSLTGYENRDANSGVPDEEVFLYDASTGRLVCASCNPTGARPVGLREGDEIEEPLVDWSKLWQDRWLAGSVPGWTPKDLGSAIYQPRYLSDSGRLFFDSSDALVPADVNGREDVYEYEPDGVGSCQGATHGQSASIVYSEGVGGCVALISSGTSSEESTFMDASETGGDVFFLTLSKLSPQDYDNSLDMYDAHECTASAPCAPPASPTPPPCTTGDACKPGPTPQPALFGEPASETFSGAGNVAPSTSESKVTVRSAGDAQKLAKALKACRKKPKRRRAGCEQRARGKYGAKRPRIGKSLSARARR